MTKLAKGALAESKKIHAECFAPHIDCQFKTGDLWKDKPDPVAGFSPGSQFSEDGVVDGRLGGEEAVEIRCQAYAVSVTECDFRLYESHRLRMSRLLRSDPCRNQVSAMK